MIVLYSTGCPKCQVLEKKMNVKGIHFEVIDDEKIMIDKGFMSLPMLEVDNEVMDFRQAISWVDSQE